MSEISHDKIIHALIERDGPQCSICGRTFFNSYELSVHHIIPTIEGGTHDLENLILVCPKHNMILGRKTPLLEVEFNRDLETLMKGDSKIRNVQSEFKQTGLIRVDFLFEEMVYGRWKKVILESKTQWSYTVERAIDIISQIQHYKKTFPQVNLVFSFPGKLAPSTNFLFKQADIEVWDLDYLVNRFKAQIENVKNPLLKHLLLSVDRKPQKIYEEELLDKLRLCPAGRTNWSEYQRLIGSILEVLFYPPLEKPISELSDSSRVNRRDFIIPNYVKEGFWAYLRSRYTADYIVIDAKNYREKVKKKDALQIFNYLKLQGAGLFGIIICRNGADTGCMHTIRETWFIQQKLIIVLTDTDVEQMLLAKKAGTSPELTIQQKIEDFRLSL